MAGCGSSKSKYMSAVGELGVVAGQIEAGLHGSRGDAGRLAAVHEFVAVLFAGPLADSSVDWRDATLRRIQRGCH